MSIIFGLIISLWKDFQPVQHELIVRRLVTSIACDDQIIVCGYTDGASEVFSNVTGDFIDRISDNKEDINYSSSKVKVGKNIIAKIAYGTDQSSRVGKCSIGIWTQITYEKVYGLLLDNKKDCVYLQEHGSNVFIR